MNPPQGIQSSPEARGLRLAERIVETLSLPLLILERDLRVKVASRSFYRQYQVSPGETEGRPVFELGNGQWNIPALRTLLGEVLSGEREFEDFEVRHDFPHIGPRVMILSGRRIDPEGPLPGLILLSLEDVTDRRKIEESLAEYRLKLERTNAELTRSNGELERFAYVASHDLQEPLRMVASYTQLLARRYEGKLDPDADDFIRFAVEGATRMQTLINDLLSYSRAGRAAEPAKVSAEEALRRAVENLRGAVTASGAIITHDPLPEVWAIPSQFAQLLQNLIANAVKFRGPEAPRVHVSASSRPGEVVFGVRDNGIGIPQAFVGRLFVVFQRLHTKEEYPGTGIGLAIAKRIVDRLGGRIWVESSPGQGSTFFFTVPRKGEGS